MIAILATYVVMGLLIVAFGRRLGRAAFLVGAFPLLVTVVWVVARLADVVDGRVFTSSSRGSARSTSSFDLRLDGLAATMTLIVAGRRRARASGTRTATSRPDTPDPRPARPALLVLFAGAMVGLVQSDNFYILTRSGS